MVATLHRPANVDNPERAAELVQALHEMATKLDVIIPLDPRGRATLTAAGLLNSERSTRWTSSATVEFMSLVRGAAAIVTDSGGMQEETRCCACPAYPAP